MYTDSVDTMPWPDYLNKTIQTEMQKARRSCGPYGKEVQVAHVSIQSNPWIVKGTSRFFIFGKPLLALAKIYLISLPDVHLRVQSQQVRELGLKLGGTVTRCLSQLWRLTV